MRFTRFQSAVLMAFALVTIVSGLAIIPRQFTGHRPEWPLTIAMLATGHVLLLVLSWSAAGQGRTSRNLLLNLSLIALTMLVVTQRRQPPLEYQLEQAVDQGRLDAVERLLRRGVDPDVGHAARGYSWTPLQSACWHGYAEIASALMRAGANVDYEEKDGFTALIYAARSGHWSIVHALLDAGADPNLRGTDGISLRQHAKTADRSDVLRRLTLTQPP